MRLRTLLCTLVTTVATLGSLQAAEPAKSVLEKFPMTAAPVVIPSQPEIADITMGKASAPITFINYSSINCAHCAKFDKEILPLMESTYIQPGKMSLVFKHFPIDLAAVEYMTLIAKQPHDRWFALVDTAYQRQGEWVGHPPEKLAEILGLSKEDCKAALDSEVTKEMVMAKRYNAEKAGLDIPATPTFQLLFSVKGDKKSILITTGISKDDLFQIIDHVLSIADPA